MPLSEAIRKTTSGVNTLEAGGLIFYWRLDDCDSALLEQKSMSRHKINSLVPHGYGP